MKLTFQVKNRGEFMRAEDTLQFMMDFQSDLFYNRQKCLDHLFCTIGNGYDWVDGELIENSRDTTILLSRWQLTEPINHAEPTLGVVTIGKIKEDMYNRRNLEVPKWSTLSKKYSYLYNYPDDIKPDWKALLEECKQMLIDDGIDIENILD